jgi:hypothetical protein
MASQRRYLYVNSCFISVSHPHCTKLPFLLNKLWNQSCPSDTAADSCLCASTIFRGPDCWLSCICNKKSLYAMSVLWAYKWVADICCAAIRMFSNTNMKLYNRPFLRGCIEFAAIWTLFMWKEPTISCPSLTRLCDYPLLKISEAFLSIIGFIFLFLSNVICEALILLWNWLCKMAVTFSVWYCHFVFVYWLSSLLCVFTCVI